MIGVIVMAHGKLADEFLKVAEQIMGPQKHVFAYNVDSENMPENAVQELEKIVNKLNQGSGVLLLTDLFGGSPSNLALSILETGKTEVLAGLNLPMLLKVLSLRDKENLNDLVHHAQEAAKKYIRVGGDLLLGHE